MVDRFLRIKQVMERVPLSKRSIYDRVAKGVFPKPIHIGANATAWIEREVNEWIGNQIRSQRSETEKRA